MPIAAFQSTSCLPCDCVFRVAWLGTTHPHVLQGTRQPGEDTGHRREPERGPQVPEHLADGTYKLSGGTSILRLVVEPVEDDGEVYTIEHGSELASLPFALLTTSRNTPPIFSRTSAVPSPSAEVEELGSSARVRRAASGPRWEDT